MAVDEAEPALAALRDLLDRTRRQGRTVTYLEAADAIRLPPPKRIHRLTRMLERLTREDVRNGRPIRAALVVSRVRAGLPAPGFFDLLVRLGVADADRSSAQVQDALLHELFGQRDAD